MGLMGRFDHDLQGMGLTGRTSGADHSTVLVELRKQELWKLLAFSSLRHSIRVIAGHIASTTHLRAFKCHANSHKNSKTCHRIPG